MPLRLFLVVAPVRPPEYVRPSASQSITTTVPQTTVCDVSSSVFKPCRTHAKYQGIHIQMMLHLARCEDGETAVHQQSQPCPVSKDRCTGHHQPTTRSSHGGRPPVRRFARATIRVRRFARATIRHGGGPPVQRFARLTIQAPPPCTARPFDTGESRPCGDSPRRRFRPPPCTTTRPFDTEDGRPCDDSPVWRFRRRPPAPRGRSTQGRAARAAIRPGDD